jgi:hypothetical protein
MPLLPSTNPVQHLPPFHPKYTSVLALPNQPVIGCFHRIDGRKALVVFAPPMCKYGLLVATVARPAPIAPPPPSHPSPGLWYITVCSTACVRPEMRPAHYTLPPRCATTTQRTGCFRQRSGHASDAQALLCSEPCASAACRLPLWRAGRQSALPHEGWWRLQNERKVRAAAGTTTQSSGLYTVPGPG